MAGESEAIARVAQNAAPAKTAVVLPKVAGLEVADQRGAAPKRAAEVQDAPARKVVVLKDAVVVPMGATPKHADQKAGVAPAVRLA